MRQPSPVIAFLTHYLKTTPDATYESAKSAAEAAGHRVVPLHYANALRVIGREGTRRRPASRSGPAHEQPAGPAAPRAPGRRRGRLTAESFGGMLADFEEIVAERDRARAALVEIAAILKKL